MSLGFARDSILNLQQLAREEEAANAPSGHGGSDEENRINGNHDDDIGMFLDDEEESLTQSTMIPFPAATPAPIPERTAAEGNAPRETKPETPMLQVKPEKESADAMKMKQYEGFASDYAEYASYYENDPYAVNYGGYVTQQVGKGSVKKNIFCCIFTPWNANDDLDASCEEESEKEERGEEVAQGTGISGAVAIGMPAEVGVSASLKMEHMAACDATREEEKKAEDFGTEHHGQVGNAEKAAANEIQDEVEEKEKPVDVKTKGLEPSTGTKTSIKKGILKKCKRTTHKSSSADASKVDDSSAASGDNRRHMFPSYSREVADSHSKKTTKLSFAPMARVVTVTSRKEMAFVQKSQVWWQRTDYDDFKKTGRIIAKAMLEGGSEIWLTSNDAWGKKRASSSRTQLSRSVSSDAGNEDERDTDYERALHKYSGGLQQEAGEQPQESESSFGNKWWCKFGHSRRGLEHIASMEEGRQRQRNVNTAIRAVVDEQRKQRSNRTKDPHKLANIAHQYTSWARDLALAAGAADAEAVRVNFKVGAKCRSHYLVTGIKEARESTHTKFTDSKKYSFISGHIVAELLDANTSSSMKTKQEEVKQRRLSQHNAASGDTPGSQAQRSREDQFTPPLVDETEEAIHDPNAANENENMAKRAAGFAANEDEKVDMAAVLTGMGSVTVQG